MSWFGSAISWGGRLLGFGGSAGGGRGGGGSAPSGGFQIPKSTPGFRPGFTPRGGGFPKPNNGTTNTAPVFRRAPLAWLDKHAWGLQAADQMIGRLQGLFDDSQPGFFHAISVTIQGGPHSDLRRVWYLCLAVAFGRLRNRVRSIQQSEMDATWDVTGKACSVTVGYYHNGIVGAAQRVLGTEGIQNPLQVIWRGPDQITVGGSWPDWLQATTTQSNGVTNFFGVIGGKIHDLRQRLGVSGETIKEVSGITVTNNPDRPGLIPPPQWQPVFEIEDGGSRADLLFKFSQFWNSARSLFVEAPTLAGGSDSTFLPWSRLVPIGGSVVGRLGSQTNSLSELPTLPDDGRLITTGQKYDPRVQNPRPPIDGKSRASFVQLVAAALANPGILPDSPPGGFVSLGSPGVYIYPPGTGLEDERVNNGRFSLAVGSVEAAEGAGAGTVGTLVPPIGPDGTTIDGYKVEQRIPNVRQP